MPTDITLRREDFAKLLGSLKLIADAECSDCEIVDGKVRQSTNNRRSIIELNLESLIGKENLPLLHVAKKVDLLRTFDLDDSIEIDNDNVILSIEDQKYRFMDVLSSMTFRNPVKDFLDNKYIPEEKFGDMLSVAEADIIMSIEIGSYMSKRIKNISRGFSNDMVECIVKNNKADVYISTVDGSSNSIVVKDIGLRTEMNDFTFKLIVLPFTLDIDSDVSIDIYKKGTDTLMCKSVQSYFGIPVTIYTQSKIITAE